MAAAQLDGSIVEAARRLRELAREQDRALVTVAHDVLDRTLRVT